MVRYPVRAGPMLPRRGASHLTAEQKMKNTQKSPERSLHLNEVQKSEVRIPLKIKEAHGEVTTEGQNPR